MVRPSCTPAGNYKLRQCHLSHNDEGLIEKVCVCVDELTGEPSGVESCPEETEDMRQHEHEELVGKGAPPNLECSRSPLENVSCPQKGTCRGIHACPVGARHP